MPGMRWRKAAEGARWRGWCVAERRWRVGDGVRARLDRDLGSVLREGEEMGGGGPAAAE